MKNKKVLIIQPHSDDVIFSASKYLFEKKKYKKVKILTVEYDEKRLEEDKAFCEHYGVDLTYLKTRVCSENFHKEYYQQYSEMNEDDCLDFCIKKIGTKQVDKLSEELIKTLKKYKKNGYEIVTCLGVGHPFHLLVTLITSDIADLFYREFPHSYKRRNQKYLNFILENDYSLAFEHYDAKQHAEKFESVAKFYKSQKSLLFFEKRYIDKNLPEQYFKRK
ncbi:MAG: hypothetical protein ABIN48_11590 [Ginsengibacter sp.]